MTGSALAMPLLAATGAHAADAPTWDRVAQCESGGMWSANAGNGSYGGLQLTQELWEQNGGRTYAPRPDLASRSQQIAVAEKILNGSGPGTWRNCGTSAGLGKNGPAPEVNPGSTKDPSREAPSAPRAPEHSPSPSTGRPDSDASARPTEPSKPAEPSGSAKPSEPSSSPSPSAPAPSGTPSGSAKPGKDAGSPSGTPSDTPSAPAGERPDAGHGGTPTDDPTEIPTGSGPSAPGPVNPPTGTPGTSPGPADSGTPGTPAGEGTGKHRADPPRSDGGERPSRGGDEARPGVPAAGDYTVRAGDNLSAIAEKHSVTGGWHSLYERNEKVVGKDPDLILPGQKLEMGK
ncbi:transglycosylase family protein [Streptomyces albireticuli]|uniref:transglycosylase family protein n=1 Tax=Streptomyces albireticuli TaxID=1940 RepID=UPI0027E2DB4A|nr:transglycosylase family protein [Streptomyces albireticuli]